MGNTLSLNLKKKWFDMILSGEKKEEYREIKPYWCSRLLLYQGEHKTLNWWEEWMRVNRLGNWTDSLMLICNEFVKNISIKNYTDIDFLNGMTPPVPRFEIEHKGIEIREGKSKWGAKDGEKYFVIKLGLILNKQNIRDERA